MSFKNLWHVHERIQKTLNIPQHHFFLQPWGRGVNAVGHIFPQKYVVGIATFSNLNKLIDSSPMSQVKFKFVYCDHDQMHFYLWDTRIIIGKDN
jgi:hypothetical protein